MKLNADVQDIPWKKVAIVAMVLIVVVAVAYGLKSSGEKSARHQPPLTPEANKAAVIRYLRDKAAKAEFTPSIDVSKEKNPWNTLSAQYDAPPDYKTVYRNIGEHLVIAERLLNEESDRDQMNGMRIVAELCDIAIDVAVDPWLGARISDGYLIPNLDKIEEKPKNGPSREQFMARARRVYREAEESDRLIDLSKAYLAQNPPVERGDKIRYGLARELEQQGDHKEALKYFREITLSTLTNDASRRIANIEQRLKTAGAK